MLIIYLQVLINLSQPWHVMLILHPLHFSSWSKYHLFIICFRFFPFLCQCKLLIFVILNYAFWFHFQCQVLESFTCMPLRKMVFTYVPLKNSLATTCYRPNFFLPSMPFRRPSIQFSPRTYGPGPWKCAKYSPLCLCLCTIVLVPVVLPPLPRHPRRAASPATMRHRPPRPAAPCRRLPPPAVPRHRQLALQCAPPTLPCCQELAILCSLIYLPLASSTNCNA